MKFKRFNKTYRNIRRFFGLTCEEYDMAKILITRALWVSRLSDKIIGFQMEEKPSKCIYYYDGCKNLTNLYAVVQREFTKKLYLVPICPTCIENRLRQYIEGIIANMKRLLTSKEFLVYLI